MSVDSSPRLAVDWPLDRQAAFELVAVFSVLVVASLAIGGIFLGWDVAEPVRAFDRRFADWIHGEREPTLNQYSDVASSLADTVVVVLLAVVSAGAFGWVWRRWKEPLSLALGLGLEAFVFVTVSVLIGRDRPPITQLDAAPPTASFPSGHVGAAVTFSVLMVFVVFWHTRRAVWRAAAIAGGVMVSIAVATARLYRGMHFPSDVIAGAIVGSLCAVAAVRIVERAIARREERT